MNKYTKNIIRKNFGTNGNESFQRLPASGAAQRGPVEWDIVLKAPPWLGYNTTPRRHRDDAQWFQIVKTCDKISSFDVISRVFSSKFQQKLQLFPFPGLKFHTQNLSSMISQFHEFLKFYFWRFFCNLDQLCDGEVSAVVLPHCVQQQCAPWPKSVQISQT